MKYYLRLPSLFFKCNCDLLEYLLEQFMQMFSSVNNVWESINLVLCNLLNWIECAGFFNKCSQPCGNCRFNDQCNMSNGLCPGGCERGYTGDNCTTGNAWLIRNGYIKMIYTRSKNRIRKLFSCFGCGCCLKDNTLNVGIGQYQL